MSILQASPVSLLEQRFDGVKKKLLVFPDSDVTAGGFNAEVVLSGLVG